VAAVGFDLIPLGYELVPLGYELNPKEFELDIWLARFMKGNWRVREIKIRLKETVDIISPCASAGEKRNTA
jgi:hypothetical protein